MMSSTTSALRKYIFIFVQFFLFLSFAKAETKNFTNVLPKATLTKSEITSPIVYVGGSGTITRTANLTGFTACFGTASGVQTFTVSGTFTTTNNTIVLTAPAGFEMSIASGAYSNTGTITQASAGTVTTTVSIRLSATATAGTYTGTLNITSSSATTDLTILMPSSTVTSLPSVNPITGTLTTCIGVSTTLSSTTTGGTWSSSASGIASINSLTGLVQGVALGNATITYTVASGVNSACTNSVSAIVAVNALPTVNAITGTLSTCIGGSNTLTSTTTGGTWASSATGIATIGATTGIVQGVAAGNATITYTVASGVNSACANSTTAVVVVNSLPTATAGVIATVLTNATTFSIPLSATTGTPDQYSVIAGSPVLTSFVAASGTISGTSINVTLPASKTAGNYGFTLRVKRGSTGCESAASNISLNVARIVTSGTISAFTTCLGTASASQSFTVTSSDLTNNLTITAPSGYEVSRISSTSGYQDTVVLAQSSGSIAATAIYVRIKASATSSNSGNISLVSSGSTTVNITIPSSTINSLPTVSVTGSKFYTVVGTNLSLTGSATAASSNTWSSSNTSVGTVSSTTTAATFVPVANGSTDVTYRNLAGCTVTNSIIVGPAIPSLSSVTAGQEKNYLRWTVPSIPPTFVDSIQVHRATDSLGAYTKIATVFNDTSKSAGVNAFGKPANIGQYTYLGSFNGSEYYLSNSNLTQLWGDARNTAIAEGGQLVCLETPEENAYFQGRLGAILGGTSIWAGGYQINNLVEPKGNWYWVNGKPMTLDMPGTNFGNNSGEPNNSGGEDYLEVYSSGWNDLFNTTKRFVIEYDGKASLNNPNYTDNSLTNGTKYFYKLSSFTKSNSAVSGFGNIKSATPQVGVKLPNTLRAQTVSNVVRLQWTNETGQAAGNYEIHRSLDSFKVTSFIVKTLANTTTSFLDSNLANQVYYYRIKAVDANGVESNFSDIITTQKVVNKIYVATTGVDTNLGSEDSPLKTLSKAISNSFTGDTIILAKGTYANSASINIGKQVFISSNYLTTKDSADITGTIITGGTDFSLFTGSAIFTMNGLTIQNHRGLVFNPSSSIAIYASIIKNNGNSSSFNSPFIYLRNNSILSQSRIESNIGVITLEGSGNKLEQNFFFRNRYSQENNATQLINGWKGKTFITNNLFVENGNDFTNNWDGFRSAVIEPGGWGGDSTFIINNTFIKNKGLAIHVSLSDSRTMVIVNNLIYNPAGDVMFYNPRNNSSRNRSTIFLNNTLIDSLKYYNSQGFYNITESGNIYGQDISRMYDTVLNKLKSNFVGIKEGVYDLLNKSGVSYYKVPLFDFYKNARTTSIDIGAERVTSSLPSPILDNVEGGDNMNNILVLKPYSGLKISSFSIFRDTKEITDTNTILKPIFVTKTNADLKYIDSAVNNGVKYFYRIKSNLAGATSSSEFSNQITVTPNIPPSRVDSLFISSAPRSALLTWKKIAAPVKYLVLGGRNKDSLNVIANGVDTSFFKVTDLVANTNYWFTVKTIDSGGAVSKSSNIVQLKLTSSWFVDTLPNSIQIGSSEFPYNSLQATIDNAKNGDTVLVKPGVYASFKVSNKSILIKTTDGPSKTSLSDINKVGYLVRIDGNTNGNRPYPVAVISGFSISDFAFYNNMPNLYPYGIISITENTSPIFENCIIQNNKSKSTIGSENAAPTFVNSIISNNDNLFWIPSNDTANLNFRTVKFVNSNIINNSNWGYINTGNTRGKMPFLNCIIWGNGKATMLKDGSSENHLVINSIVDDKVYSIKPGNINKDPLFDDISSGSYQLSNSSPALGKGAPYLLLNLDTLYAAKNDFEYNTRPLPAGTSIDIGAFENKNYFPAPNLLELNRDINDKNILSITFNYDSTLSLNKFQLFRDTLRTALDTVKVYKELVKTTPLIVDTISNGKTFYYALKLVTTDNKFSGLSNIKNSNDTINVPAVNFLSDTASIRYNNSSNRLKFNLVNLSSDPENNKFPHLIFYDDSYRLVDTNESRIDQYDTLYILNSAKGSGNNSIKFDFNTKIKLTSRADYYQKILPPFNINFDDEFDIPIIRRRNNADNDYWNRHTEIITLRGKVTDKTIGQWNFDNDSTTNYYGEFKTNYSQIVKGEIPSNSTVTKKISYDQYSHEMPNIRDDADYIDGNFDGKQEYVVSPMQIKWASAYTQTNNTTYHEVNNTLKLIEFVDVNNDGVKDVFATTNYNWQIGLNSVGGSPLMVFVSNKKIGSYELFYTNISLDYNTSIYIGPLKNALSGIYVIARTSGSTAYNTFRFDKSTNRLTTNNVDYKLKINLQDSRFDVSDVNGDGFPDIAQFANSGDIQIYLNNQLDGFKDVSKFENPFIRDGQGNNYPYSFRLLDINNDGYKDLVWNEYANNNNTYQTRRILRALIQTPIKSRTIPTLAAPKNLIGANNGYEIKVKWDRVLNQASNSINTYNVKIDTSNTFKNAKLNTFYNYRASNPRVPIVLDGMKFGSYVDSVTFKDNAVNSTKPYFVAIQTVNSDGYVSAETQLTFTPKDVLTKSLKNILPGLSNSRLAWGDYNNDGLMDLAVMGRKEDGSSFTAIYQNKAGVLTDLGLTNIPLLNGDLKWADINNDGWLDLLAVGQFSASRNRVQLFTNRKSFFEITEPRTIPALRNSTIAFGDHDANGTIDLVIIGADSLSNARSFLLNNDGKGNFAVDNSSQIIPSMCDGDIRFIDFDLDGDLDLIYAGSNKLDQATAIGIGGIKVNTLLDPKNTINYINSFNTNYVQGLNLANAKFDLGDVDNDGDMDIVLIGTNQNGGSNTVATPILKMIKNLSRENRSSNNFSNFINTQESIIDSVDQGSVKFADYNNDGLLDLAYTGTNKLKSPTTKILLNLGGFNNFDTVKNLVLPQYASSTVAWADYDNTGTVDLIVSGENKGVSALSVFVNDQGENKNLSPSIPNALNVTDFGLGRVMLSWAAPEDDRSTKNSLYYQIRVGTTAGGSEIMTVPVNKVNGKFKLLTSNTTLINGNSYYLELMPGKYFWSVMAIDNNFESSDFSQESSFTISYPWKFVNQGGLIDRRIQPVDNPAFAWADFNNDGLSDFIYLGSQSIFSSGPTGIYENQRNKFAKVNTTGLEGLTGLKNIEVKCVDINADGFIDIVIAGEDPFNFSSTPTFRVYQNEKNNFRFADVTTKFNIPQTLRTPKLEFSDFDNDGYLDMIYGGTQANGTGTVNIFKISKDTAIKTIPNTAFKVTTLRNNLAQLISANDPQNIQFAFGDLNKDKTFDLITTYEGIGFARFTDIYTNVFDSATNSNVFTKFTGFALPKIKNGKIELVDFNNDGLLDIAVTGYATGIGEIFNVYQNNYSVSNGLNFVNVTTSGLQPVQNSKTTWGDYNGDGYQDVIFSGDRDGFGYVTKMATSSKGAAGFTQFNELTTFPFGNYSKLTPSMGDIGGDGQLGFVLVGSEKDPLNPNSTTLYKSFRILQNVRNAAAKVQTSSNQTASLGQKVALSNGATNIANNTSSVFKPLNIQNLTTLPFVTDVAKIDQELDEAVYIANAAPSSPILKNLNVVRKRDNINYLVQFNWNKSKDDNTPISGLTYSLSVGTANGTSDVVIAESELKTGIQKKPQDGNVGKDTSWQISLPPGKYYYSVQAIDASYAGSTFSDRKMFTLSASGDAKEATPPSDILFNDSSSTNYYFRKGDSANFKVLLKAISKDATAKYKLTLESGTSSIFNLDAVTNTLTVKSKLIDTLYKIIVKGADTLGSDLVKTFNVYVRQSADKILLNSIDTSVIKYTTGVDSSLLVTGLQAVYTSSSSNASTNFIYKLASGTGDLNNASFFVRDNVLVNKRKLNSADTLTVRVSAIDEFGINTDKIIQFISTCSTKPSLSVVANSAICSPGTINLTDTNYRKGSLGTFTVGYFSDANEINVLKDPTKIATSGIYYIKATNADNCSVMKPMNIVINPKPANPVVTPLALCTNSTATPLTAKTSPKSSLNWYGTSATGGTAAKTAPTPVLSNAGVTSYFVSQVDSVTGCESDRAKIDLTVNLAPVTPILVRDTAGNLVPSVTTGIRWFRDGVLIDSTSARLKPTIASNYTVRVTNASTGCSTMSAPYYFLVTDIIRLSWDEFIKLTPNPFINFVNIDFVVKGHQRLNIEVFSAATGAKVASRIGVTAGTRLTFNELNPGVYFVRVASPDLKVSHQFKMVKL